MTLLWRRLFNGADSYMLLPQHKVAALVAGAASTPASVSRQYFLLLRPGSCPNKFAFHQGFDDRRLSASLKNETEHSSNAMHHRNI
jgi:hypothetical protein